MSTTRPPYHSTGLRPDAERPRRWRPDERVDLWLLGPYFGLHEPPVCSLHTATVTAAYAELDTSRPATPFQCHTPRGLREAVAQCLRWPELASPGPAALPDELVTERWRALVRLTEHPLDLDLETRLRLGTLLCALGLDACALGVLPASTPEDAGRDQLSAGLAMKRTHALVRASGSEAARAEDREVLTAVATSRRLPAATALSAALTLVVLNAKGRAPDVAATAHWREVAGAHLAGLALGGSWRDALFTSAYWRAVSYLPFLLGDHERTRAELDRAEEHARDLPDGTEQQALVRRQNLHPLLETRTRAAAAANDLDAALRYAHELAALDPYDGKVLLGLGDVAMRAGDTAAAVEAYRRAAMLGAPHAARARVALGRHLEHAGDEEGALDSFLAAAHADPTAYTAVAAVHRLAERTGRADLADWCVRWLADLRARLRVRPERTVG